MCCARREENHVVAVFGKSTDPRRFSQNPLTPISKNGIAKPFSRNEGNPARVAFVRPGYTNSQERIVVSLPPREDPLKFSLGFDGLHEHWLDGELLAALGTTTGENLASSLGGHTSTETVGLCALALVGLIRTLHSYSSQLGMNFLFRALSPKIVKAHGLTCQFILKRSVKNRLQNARGRQHRSFPDLSKLVEETFHRKRNTTLHVMISKREFTETCKFSTGIQHL